MHKFEKIKTEYRKNTEMIVGAIKPVSSPNVAIQLVEVDNSTFWRRMQPNIRSQDLCLSSLTSQKEAITMTSIQMRENPLFMRNTFKAVGKFGIPLVKKQEIDLSNINLISCSNARLNDIEENKTKGIHFFVDDYRFEGIYNNPERTLAKYSQYAFLLTPDFSTYAEMNIWRQIESVAMNRWCGAYWQSKGINVIPTISWSTPRSYDFCFDGVESESVVAIGMIGCKKNHLGYMRGYNAMLKKLSPKAIICLGTPFPEMEGNIISVDYTFSKKGGH